MNFSLMFFSSCPKDGDDQYGLLRKAAVLGDEYGLTAVWVPERHFHRFGGGFPNPSIAAAALSTLTRDIALRAGSVVSPLHDVVRIAEEWAAVDNWSNGRVAISLGAGWNSNDFVLHPGRYTNRYEILRNQVDELRRLWRGEPVKRRNGSGELIELQTWPRPVQDELPLWISSSGGRNGFHLAAEVGANVLTHLLFQGCAELQRRILKYRELGQNDRTSPKQEQLPQRDVTVMLHTYLAESVTEAVNVSTPALVQYLATSMELESAALQGGGSGSGGRSNGGSQIPARDIQEIAEIGSSRLLEGHSLVGTVESVKHLVDRLKESGVTEIACLIDFGLPDELVLSSLKRIGCLCEEYQKA